MLKRNIRQRREYLYRKSLEGKERLLYEKKRKIREALEEGKPIPTELRNEEAALRKEIDLEDKDTAVPKSHIDDEYANAAQSDPKIFLTTSRDPSQPLTQFTKELKFVFPNAERVNRGSQVISEIIESCRAHDFTDVILVHEHRGVPDGLIISHLPFGPTAYFGLHNVVTRHDIKDRKAIGTMPEAYPHLIINNFTTEMGEKVANILKHLFPVSKPDTKRIVTFANKNDYISFRNHIYEKRGGPDSVELKEIGPHFELIHNKRGVYRWMHEPFDREAIFVNVALNKGDYELSMTLLASLTLRNSWDLGGPMRPTKSTAWRKTLHPTHPVTFAGSCFYLSASTDTKLLFLLISAYRYKTNERGKAC